MAVPHDHEAQAALTQILSATTPTGTGTSREAALTALAALHRLKDQLDAWESRLIADARTTGASWAELAPAMGLASRQAAERRYLRIRRTEHDDATATGDQRVTAERDRRAGARAITGWARDNGADLRQLAGQITALTDLGASAQPGLDRLHRALGGNDPAALLPLLADIHEHLRPQHAALAARIAAVTGDTDQVRRATQRRREDDRRAPRL